MPTTEHTMVLNLRERAATSRGPGDLAKVRSGGGAATPFAAAPGRNGRREMRTSVLK
jgi:hypothetical protein